MPAITADGHTFSIDGRRMWIVSATVHTARSPSEAWPDRLRDVVEAGFNTVELPLVWARHEPVRGKFDFAGDNDVASFVRQAAARGLKVILRLGPVVGAGYDLGGMPSWLIPASEGRLRTDHPEFLACCSAYFSALGQQLRRLQATATGTGPKPIIAAQIEHEWCCDMPELADEYLGQLNRFAREAGFAVPVFARNSGFAAAEGDTEVWSGREHLLAITRQLRAVHPSRPPIVMGLAPAEAATWERPAPDPSADDLLRNAAEVLAAGGQFNIDPLFAGSCFGFEGGRLPGSPDAFVRAAWMPGAPVGVGGERSASFFAIKRLATFATRFERVFTALEPARSHVTSNPAAMADASRKGDGAAVIDQVGSSGRVVFLIRPGSASQTEHDLLLPDGSALRVPMGDQSVSWVLMGVNLGGRARLDYCTLNALGWIGGAFVCFGPAGAEGSLSLNGSHVDVTVPDGPAPFVETHEGMTVAVCNTAAADTVFFGEKSVFIGAAGLDDDGEPIAMKDGRDVLRLGGIGAPETISMKAPSRTPASIKLGGWSTAGCEDWLDGSSERYALIDGPSSMESLGVPTGYAWLRIRFKQSSAKRYKLGFTEFADRGHVFLDGEMLGVIGAGPGAEPPILNAQVKGGEHTVVVLVDNLGRDDSGNDQHRPKGMFGHVHHLTAVKGAPALEDDEPIEPLELRAPIFGLHTGDLTDARRLTWTLTHRKKSSLMLHIGATPCPVLVVLNGTPVQLFDQGRPAAAVFDSEQLVRGKNAIQIAILGDMDEHLSALKDQATLYECAETISDGSPWAFGKWESPRRTAFEDIDDADFKSSKLGKYKGLPRWWKCSFSPRDTDMPLRFDATGLSKGQIFLNGRNVCRYFVQTPDPQVLYRLPGGWLDRGGTNEILVFDEDGFAPTKCRLTYSAG